MRGTGRALWLFWTCVMFSMPDFLQVHYPLLTGGGTYRSIRLSSERAAACKCASDPPSDPASSGGSGSGPPPGFLPRFGFGEVSPHKALHYAHVLLPRPPLFALLTAQTSFCCIDK